MSYIVYRPTRGCSYSRPVPPFVDEEGKHWLTFGDSIAVDVGLYNNSSKKSIVEKFSSDVRYVENGESAKRKVSWAEVLMKNVRHEKGT